MEKKREKKKEKETRWQVRDEKFEWQNRQQQRVRKKG